MTSTMVIPTSEQDVYSFMNRSFFPPWKVIQTSYGLSEDISCYFMGGNNRKEKGGENMKTNKTTNNSIAPLDTETPETPEKELILDWRYWAFWTAWISFHGLSEYNLIPENKRLAVWRDEKMKMSSWFEDNFLVAKKEIAKRWNKMTNMDMEDAITSLITDMNEQESGLKTLLLCWTYYSMTMETKGAMECIWVVHEKSLFYSFAHGLEDSPSSSSVESWGVFMEILEPKNGREKKGVKGVPPRKPLKTQKRFLFRALEKGEVESIRKEMIEFKAVNRPLAAVSKYTLKELMEMGEKVGIQPPMISVLDEKGNMKLDLAEKVRMAERELGVIRKAEDKKILKGEVKKVEKWKKENWYESLEEHCLDVF